MGWKKTHSQSMACVNLCQTLAFCVHSKSGAVTDSNQRHRHVWGCLWPRHDLMQNQRTLKVGLPELLQKLAFSILT